MKDKCPVCKTTLAVAGGIGIYCPNTDCEVFDAPGLYDETGTKIAEAPKLMNQPEITLKVKKITVVIGSGTDDIIITCEGPASHWPFDSGEFLAKIHAAHGKGAEYVRENFGIEPEVIDTIHKNT